MPEATVEITDQIISKVKPTFAGKPVYEENDDYELSPNPVINAAVWGVIGIGMLAGELSKPRQVLSYIRDVARDPKGYLEKFKEATRDIETPEHLYMQVYGHRDVIDRFSGKIPKSEIGTDTKPRKLCIIALGGGQGGNMGAGTLRGMQDVGAYQRADGIIMVSAGIPNTMYTEAGQNAEGVKIYQDDNTKEGFFVKLPKDKKEAVEKFVQHLRHVPADPIVDTTTVADGMRNRRPLDIEAIRNSQKELVAVVMDAETGEPNYIDLKTAEDPITVEDAGLCIPTLSSVSSVKLENGKNCVDGGSADPIPLQWALDHGYTDVIILANSPIIKNNGLLARTFQSLILERLARNPKHGYGEPVVKKLKDYQKNLSLASYYVNEVIKKNDPNQRVAVIEPYDNSMSGLLETNRDRLITAYNDAANFAAGTFNGFS